MKPKERKGTKRNLSTAYSSTDNEKDSDGEKEPIENDELSEEIRATAKKLKKTTDITEKGVAELQGESNLAQQV